MQANETQANETQAGEANDAAGTRSARMKQATTQAHDRLDNRVMIAEPFASRERYALFLEMQRRLQEQVEPLYQSAELNALLPGLAERSRLTLLRQDMADLALPDQAYAPPPAPADRAAALGWLYVSEGSNLGAAFLLKAAARLGLSESFGARHLAGAPEGRGLHWRRFTEALNGAPLSPEEDAAAIAGAEAAFRRAHALVEEVFAASEPN